ncbi:MAG: aminotransferase class I/II-fold pyridoxal phosphate-dependent enzyme, partial [Candidatus Thorarchaeota archaeon]
MEIPLFKIHWTEDDIEAVNNIIRSGAYWCTGRDIEEFEEEIATYLGSEYCVLLNSGGSALQALMAAHGFHKGDEIIVPSFTFIASA